MTLKLRYTGIGAAICLVAVLVFASYNFAKANPSFFNRKGTNATLATSTQAFITPGAATSTLTYDLGLGAAQGADSAILALAFTGSSTPSNSALATTTYNVSIEYSQDGIDWYGDGMFPSTTTPNVGVGAAKTHSITLGTQTTGGSLIGSTTPTRVLFEVPTPTRYVRAVFSIPLQLNGTNNANGALYAEFVSKRQNP